MDKQNTQTRPIEGADARAWHALDVKAVIETLQADPHSGLSVAEATRRFEQYGPNRLQTVGHVPWYVVFARQFLSGLILILVAAAAIALAIGEVIDAVTILAIVVLNGILGFVQEWKAERAIEALQRMLSPHCTVVRDSIAQDLDAAALVPGDVVLLKIGGGNPPDKGAIANRIRFGITLRKGLEQIAVSTPP